MGLGMSMSGMGQPNDSLNTKLLNEMMIQIESLKREIDESNSKYSELDFKI